MKQGWQLPQSWYMGNFWIRGPKWCAKWFAWHWVPDQLHGMMYAGVTVFGWSLIYSNHW